MSSRGFVRTVFDSVLGELRLVCSLHNAGLCGRHSDAYNYPHRLPESQRRRCSLRIQCFQSPITFCVVTKIIATSPILYTFHLRTYPFQCYFLSHLFAPSPLYSAKFRLYVSPLLCFFLLSSFANTNLRLCVRIFTGYGSVVGPIELVRTCLHNLIFESA